MINQVMILDSSEHVAATLSNALPNACPILSMRHSQQAIDGGGYQDKLMLSVPWNHPDAAYVCAGNFVLYQDEDGIWQEYRIVSPESNNDASSTITAQAEHTFYELLNDPIYDIRPTNNTAAQAVTSLIAGTRWQLGQADDLGLNSIRVYYTSVLAGLNAVAAQWGGELNFRLSVIGGVIAGRYVDILSRRGQTTGKRFEIGKDLTAVEQTVDRSNLYTALIGRGKGVEIDGGGNDPTYGRRLNFAQVVWDTDNGDPGNKPAGLEWIGDEAAREAYGPGGRHIYGFVVFDDCTDSNDLLRRTYDALQLAKVPQATYKLTTVVLEELSGYEHEAVRLGDTVDIINSSIVPAITGTARVIQLDRNLLVSTDCKVTLGNYMPTITSSLSQLQAAQQNMQARSGVWDRATIISADKLVDTSFLDGQIDLLQNQLAAATSNFSTDEAGNFIWENASRTAALKIGGGIFAIAKSKLNGEYDWRTFGDGTGFTADLLTAGTIDANEVDVKNIHADSISVGVIHGEQIGGGEIEARHLIDDAITTDKVAIGCITAEKLANGAVTADKIAAGSIQAYQMNWATHLIF